jgi:gentisate 1,2-dioxygenase
MRRTDALDAWHGHKLRYVNPVNGDDAIPTLSTFMQLLPGGFVSAPYRSTASTVFIVVEGSGKSEINGAVFDWQPHDIFVVPSWMTCIHTAAAESVLFSYSDQGVQQKLGFWREQQLSR